MQTALSLKTLMKCLEKEYKIEHEYNFLNFKPVTF